MRATVCIVLTAALATGGCSDPKAANETSVRKALEPTIHDRYCGGIYAERLAVPPEDGPEAWPIRVPLQPFVGFSSLDGPARALLEQGAHDGLLTRKVESFSAKRPGTFGGPPRVQSVVTYEPTAKGGDVFRPAGGGTSKNRKPYAAVCVAKAEIVDIVRWTDPADMFGQRVSRVTYRLRGRTCMPRHRPIFGRAPTSRARRRPRPSERATDGAYRDISVVDGRNGPAARNSH